MARIKRQRDTPVHDRRGPCGKLAYSKFDADMAVVSTSHDRVSKLCQECSGRCGFFVYHLAKP